MRELRRPTLTSIETAAPVDAFVRELQGCDRHRGCERFNVHFAADVLWGSPFVHCQRYDQIHAIHARMFASVVPPSKGASRYLFEHVRFPTEDVAVAYVPPLSSIVPTRRTWAPGSFDELALSYLSDATVNGGSPPPACSGPP